MKIPNYLEREGSAEKVGENRHSYSEIPISVGNISRDVGTKPVEQYETSVNAEAGRHLAVIATLGSQIPAVGVHCTNSMTIVAKVELTKRAMVAKSEALSHLRNPPIFSRNNATDSFTRQIIRFVKNPEMKFSFLNRMTCAMSK